MAMSSHFRLTVANTFLLIIVGLLTAVNGIEAGSLEPALRWTIYAVGALVIILAFREILTADENSETGGEMVINGEDE